MEELDVAIIFKALSKPVTIMGVDYNYFFIELMVMTLVFIYTSKISLLLIAIPVHIIGMVLCRIDPHIFHIISVNASIGRIKNRSIWQCQSYEAY